VALARI